MKVEKIKKEFDPIQITLENLLEYNHLKVVLNIFYQECKEKEKLFESTEWAKSLSLWLDEIYGC